MSQSLIVNHWFYGFVVCCVITDRCKWTLMQECSLSLCLEWIHRWQMSVSFCWERTNVLSILSYRYPYGCTPLAYNLKASDFRHHFSLFCLPLGSRSNIYRTISRGFNPQNLICTSERRSFLCFVSKIFVSPPPPTLSALLLLFLFALVCLSPSSSTLTRPSPTLVLQHLLKIWINHRPASKSVVMTKLAVLY